MSVLSQFFTSAVNLQKTQGTTKTLSASLLLLISFTSSNKAPISLSLSVFSKTQNPKPSNLPNATKVSHNLTFLPRWFRLLLLLELLLLLLSLRSSISPFLANCTNLQALDLSSNFPTGPIPQQLDLLVHLSAFDVSNNKLAGPIPISLDNRSGNLSRFDATSFEGNKELYGYPLPPLKSKGLSVLAIVGIGLGSGFTSLVLSFTDICILVENYRAEDGAGRREDQPPHA